MFTCLCMPNNVFLGTITTTWRLRNLTWNTEYGLKRAQNPMKKPWKRVESQVEGKVIVLYRLNLDFFTSNSYSDMRVKPLCQGLLAIIASEI